MTTGRHDDTDDHPDRRSDGPDLGTPDPEIGSPVLEAVLENSRSRRELGDRLDGADVRLSTDDLVSVIRHAPVLQTLLEGPKDRREIETALDVSRATSHRFVRWLDEHGYAEKHESRYRLTGPGEAVAEETLRFEVNVGTAHRLAPLLSRICEDHQDFVVEPFVDATVTEADPTDPHRPIRRLETLLAKTSSLRGFNTTHLVPRSFEDLHERIVADIETEFVHLPNVAETLVEAYPEKARRAMARGDLALRSRDGLPYGLVILDDHVAIAGYDEDTGALHVLVDTDAPIARQWAERVYEAVRSDSDPFPGTQDSH